MSLSPGTRLGPYEVTAHIGAGGMGEVCRAQDTQLNRNVAIKVLPAGFGTDPDRLTRFQREAQLLAGLNHPNIAAIYSAGDRYAHGYESQWLSDGGLTGRPLCRLQPLWRSDGRELFFVSRDRAMMAVDVTPGATLETGPVRKLFETSLNPTSQVHYYAVMRDGKRFLIREGVGAERTPDEPLYIVTNWTSLVR